jgi:hypothetical protein
MSDTYTLTLAEIQGFIDRAAEPLGWTRQYTNLVATTANAVSDALGSPNVVSIGATDVEGQIEAIRTSLKQRGKSPKTAGTYASVWRRLNGLLADWQTAASDGTEDTFWSTFAVNFRDPRIARRRVRRVNTPPTTSTSMVVAGGVPAVPATASYEFKLSAGLGNLTVPAFISADDIVTITEALTRRLRQLESDR